MITRPKFHGAAAHALNDAIAFMPVLLKGLGMTILLTLAALATSIVLGFIWALMGASRIGARINLLCLHRRGSDRAHWVIDGEFQRQR